MSTQKDSKLINKAVSYYAFQVSCMKEFKNTCNENHVKMFNDFCPSKILYSPLNNNKNYRTLGYFDDYVEVGSNVCCVKKITDIKPNESYRYLMYYFDSQKNLRYVINHPKNGINIFSEVIETHKDKYVIVSPKSEDLNLSIHCIQLKCQDEHGNLIQKRIESAGAVDYYISNDSFNSFFNFSCSIFGFNTSKYEKGKKGYYIETKSFDSILKSKNNIIYDNKVRLNSYFQYDWMYLPTYDCFKEQYECVLEDEDIPYIDIK